MYKFALMAMLLFSQPLHAQEAADIPVFDQEEYNRRVTKEMEEMTQALQAMSTFMVKSMNNMTHAINESIPGLTKSMGELAKSMAPIIKAAQENQELGKELDSRPISPKENTSVSASPSAPIIAEELPPVSAPAQPDMPEINTIYKPKKIRLFPAPQPDY